MSYISSTIPMASSPELGLGILTSSTSQSLSKSSQSIPHHYHPLTTDPLPLLILEQPELCPRSVSNRYETMHNQLDEEDVEEEEEEEEEERTENKSSTKTTQVNSVVPSADTNNNNNNNYSNQGPKRLTASMDSNPYQYTNKTFDMSNIDGIESRQTGEFATIETSKIEEFHHRHNSTNKNHHRHRNVGHRAHGHSHDQDSHCHDESFEEKAKEDARHAMTKLVIGLTMCGAFMLVELVGGYLSHSLAIFTDAAHLTSDLVSFGISLLAIYLGQKRPSQSNSFGYYRVEVIGVLFSVFLIWLITGILIYLAIKQIIRQEFEINSTTMLIVSALGLGVNLSMMFVLSDGFGCFAYCSRKLRSTTKLVHHRRQSEDTATIADKQHDLEEEHGGHSDGHGHSHFGGAGGGHSHMNMNVRAALLHIIGDIIQSLGVLIAAIIIHVWPHLKLADPICTLVFGVIIFVTTYSILRDALHILMEGFPREFDYQQVVSMLRDRVPLVVHVHSLHIWSLTHGRNALSVHLTVDPDLCHTPLDELTTDQCQSPNQCFERIRNIAESVIRQELKINQTTIQVEFHQAKQIDKCGTCIGPLLS